MTEPAASAVLRWRTAAALLGCAALTLACAAQAVTSAASPTAASTAASVVDPAWREQRAVPAATLPTLSGSPEISNCNQLLAALRHGADVAERLESPKFNAYANCVAGAVFDAAAGSDAPSNFDLGRVGSQIVSALDLATLRSSLAPRRPASPSYFLTDFSFVRSRIAPLSVELASATFDYRFDVLAVGDFRRNGQRELLVRFAERAKAGSYDSVRILVLVWPNDQPSMVAVDALDLLR